MHDIDETIKQLKTHKDWTRRSDAVKNLGKNKSAKAVDALINALYNDSNKYVRQNAVEQLGKVKNTKTLNALLYALRNDNYHYVRELAARELAKTGKEEALFQIIEALQNDHPKTSTIHNFIQAIGNFKNKKATDIILNYLDKKYDDVTIFCVAEALSNINDPKSIKPVLKYIGNKKNKVIYNLVRTLGNIGDEKIVEDILDSHPPVHEKTVTEALVKIEAVNKYIELLRERKGKHRHILIDTLAKINAPKATDALIKLYSKTRDYWLRIKIISILHNIEKLELLKSKEVGVLSKFSGIKGIVDTLDKNQRTKVLIKVLKIKDEVIRRKAVNEIAKNKDPECIAALTNLFKSRKSTYLNAMAIHALGEIGNIEAFNSIMNFTISEIKNKQDSNYLFKYAAESLLKLDEKKAYDFFIDAQGKFQWKSFFQPLIETLSEFDDNRSIQILENFLTGKDKYLRDIAAKVIEGKKWTPKDEFMETNYLIGTGKWCIVNKKSKRLVNCLLKVYFNESKNNQEKIAIAMAKSGKPIVIESILKWLYMSELRISSEEKISFWKDVLSGLFQDFTEIIILSSSYILVGETTEGMYTTIYDYSTDLGDRAIGKLCKIKSPLSNNILHLIANKKTISVLMHEHEEYYSNYEDLTFDNQKERAKKELGNRGNPSYEPSVYFEKDVFKIF